MVKEAREKIADILEQVGHYTGHNWRAETYDGWVYVTQWTSGNKKNRTTQRMTWDTFTHLFLLNK